MSTNPIKAFFNWLKKTFKSKFSDFAKASLNMLKTDLGQAATLAVQQAAALGLANNDQARAKAVELLKQNAKDTLAKAEADGIQIKDSFINLLVEVALNNLKGNLNGKPPA